MITQFLRPAPPRAWPRARGGREEGSEREERGETPAPKRGKSEEGGFKEEEEGEESKRRRMGHASSSDVARGDAGAEEGEVGSTYRLPLSALTDGERKRHESNLTMTPIDTFGGRSERPFQVFSLEPTSHSPTHLVVPRFYGLEHFGRPRRDASSRGEPLPAEAGFVGELTEAQRGVVASVGTAFDVDDVSGRPFPRGGLVVLPCGFGKTVVALHVAFGLVRRKCVILVHKQGLLEQWCERIRQFAPGASVGVMRQDRMDAEADVLVAMIQTVARRDCAQALADRGLVVVDECHHLGAPVFGSAMSKVGAAWCLGLSATPERKDGLTSLLFMTMGPVLCRLEREREPALVTSLVLDDKRMQHEVTRNGRPVYAAMINALASDPRRNAVLASHVARLARAGRNVLVLSERIAQLDDLRARMVSSEGVDAECIGTYTGPSTPSERERCARCAVMLSTYQMAREGLDQKHLNALCLASPTSDLTQAVGRVQRQSGRERQGPPPLVLDACDTYSLFQNQARKRRRFYRDSGFTVQKWTLSAGVAKDESGAAVALFA